MECIPLNSLRSILAESFRYLRKDGLHSHAIDCSAPYARDDDTISELNFLKFSDSDWKKHNSSFQSVNRLRHPDYLRIFRETGFSIDHEECHAEPMRDDVLAHLAAEFREYKESDLNILRSMIVARKSEIANVLAPISEKSAVASVSSRSTMFKVLTSD